MGIYPNAFNSCGASSIMKQDGFQLGMHDNIFGFKGFNHSSKSLTIFQLIIIHVKGTPVWCASNTIKVNKWNFMSNWSQMQYPLKYHYCGCMKALIDIDANGEWHLNPIDFTNFLKERNIFHMLENLGLSISARVFMQPSIPFLCFWSK